MPAAECACPKKEEGAGGSALILFLPIILITILSYIAACVAAANGASRQAVRFWLFPASFAITNFIGGMLFMVAQLFGFYSNKTTAVLDFTLFPIWGRLSIWCFNLFGNFFQNITAADFDQGVPAHHIFIFQLVLWVFVGNWIGRLNTALVLAITGRE